MGGCQRAPTGSIVDLLSRVLLASVHHGHNLNRARGDAVNHKVVGVHDDFARAVHAPEAIQVWMLGKLGGRLLDGLVEVFGGRQIPSRRGSCSTPSMSARPWAFGTAR
jgi:hypothetical protein